MDGPDRHDAFGTIRRGKINEVLRGVCDLHNLQCKDEANVTGSANFLSVFSGRFRLCAQLSSRRGRIPKAKIRRVWARHNVDGRNRNFFPEHQIQVPPEAIYCAFLVHSPRRKHRDQPAFVDIVIPDTSLRGGILTINLYNLFPDIASEVIRVPEPKRAEPQPRKINRPKEIG
jgi:hypothetical protein